MHILQRCSLEEIKETRCNDMQIILIVLCHSLIAMLELLVPQNELICTRMHCTTVTTVQLVRIAFLYL
jgi:hypothetical protein